MITSWSAAAFSFSGRFEMEIDLQMYFLLSFLAETRMAAPCCDKQKIMKFHTQFSLR